LKAIFSARPNDRHGRHVSGRRGGSRCGRRGLLPHARSLVHGHAHDGCEPDNGLLSIHPSGRHVDGEDDRRGRSPDVRHVLRRRARNPGRGRGGGQDWANGVLCSRSGRGLPGS